MGNDKNFVQEITNRDVDFSQWYTDVVKKAEMVDYSPVRGCMIYRPYGYALWENIQGILDKKFKEVGTENVYMPMFIPESLLQKEKDHIEGFAPEVAWVTHGGSEELQERLCIRPTSETLFCDHYARTVESFRDLPKVYNQWCSVVRWEKTTRPFLRTAEFLWQEGHTIHRDEKDAREKTMQMLEVYIDFVENYLAMPVIKGQKTEKEKFAGAINTYTFECMMHDGKALQSGTSHYLGTGFAEAFGIKFTDSDNKLKTPHQTSWGVSARMIGGIIMVHGDDSGLILPPMIAPVQVNIIPIMQHIDGVLDKAKEIQKEIRDIVRVKLDDSDNKPGWKFSQSEMKGIPLRIEIGPKDIEAGQVVVVRRDTREKIFVPISEIKSELPRIMETMQKDMYNRALKHREENTYSAQTMEELENIMNTSQGFVKAMWCGGIECENKIKENLGVTSRCIPFEQEKVSDKCICCGNTAKEMVYWAKAY
ncbi:MAG TPA: proline--tRNA ligase [Clostridiales bacterium]|nr:MAG: proline--tRNA ligase [Clostridiales bacterium GWD2_32_19]HCC06566.1 proline--tRNA ligase [Clostridiales bacterium]